MYGLWIWNHRWNIRRARTSKYHVHGHRDPEWLFLFTNRRTMGGWNNFWNPKVETHHGLLDNPSPNLRHYLRICLGVWFTHMQNIENPQIDLKDLKLGILLRKTSCFPLIRGITIRNNLIISYNHIQK